MNMDRGSWDPNGASRTAVLPRPLVNWQCQTDMHRKQACICLLQVPTQVQCVQRIKPNLQTPTQVQCVQRIKPNLFWIDVQSERSELFKL